MALIKYTQADFDSFPVVNGIRQCPSGDYSGIKSFGGRCSFGKGCSVFGKAFTSLTQAQLPGRYTVKKWTLADGGALYEAGCFHGTYEEAIARAGDRAAYRKAIEFLASL